MEDVHSEHVLEEKGFGDEFLEIGWVKPRNVTASPDPHQPAAPSTLQVIFYVVVLSILFSLHEKE